MTTRKLIVLNKDKSAQIEIQKEVDGLTMGVMKGGIAFLTQPSLSQLCGVSQAVLDSISAEWNEEPPPPRIAAIRKNLAAEGYTAPRAYVTAIWKGVRQRCYPSYICTSILNYFALDAGPDCQETARESIRRMNATPTPGHDSPTGDAMPPGFFNPDLMLFGLDPEDLNRSIEQCWSEHWVSEGLATRYGERIRNQASKSNPSVEEWFYPEKSVEVYRAWLLHQYYAGGKFAEYLQGKVLRREITPEQAAWALTALRCPQMGRA